MNHPQRRLLISVGMEHYRWRSNREQFEAQQALHQLLPAAAGTVGLDRSTWTSQRSGDGELTALPVGTQEPTVIGRFVPELDRLLREHNSSRLPTARVRLRVALHQGPVYPDGEDGFPGEAVTYVSRLCDTRPVKEALAASPEVAVALVVSADLYRHAVTEYPEQLRPERFRQFEVPHRDTDAGESAWLCVIGEDFTTPAVGVDRKHRPARATPAVRTSGTAESRSD